MTATVVHVKHQHDVFIGRPSPWGNPFKLLAERDREAVVQQYARWVIDWPPVMNNLHLIRGQRLGCYCAPKLCHGNVLALLADGLPPDCLDLFI